MNRTLLLSVLLLVTAVLRGEPIFDGKTLDGWKNAIPTGGKVEVLTNGVICCAAGEPMSGIVYTNNPPRMNYEISLEGMRVEGEDFFIGLTLPIGTNYCSVIIGGWGGNLCGISSIDFMDASENCYTEAKDLKSGVWYTLKVRVTEHMLDVRLNDTFYRAQVEFDKPSRFSLRPGSDIDRCVPLGICTYQTKAWWRNITLKRY